MNAQPKPDPFKSALPTEEDNITTLIETIEDCKARENRYKELRQSCEEQLIKKLGFDKPDGSKTYTVKAVTDGSQLVSSLKVTCKAGINYSIDAAAWEHVGALIPEGLRPVKLKLEVDPRGMKYLRDNEPEIYKQAAGAISWKPAKIQVSIERADKAQKQEKK